jgi:endogenous inhibitor of DNA gyrase (YacG/DUF329 family)
MSRAYCECPHCRRPVPIRWDWEALKTAHVDGDDGDVVTDSDCLDARRVMYLHHIKCPHCGKRLRVEHELVPTFYAREEACDAD